MIVSVLHANVAVCKLTALSIHKTYKKHKTHTEKEIIYHPSSIVFSSSLSAIGQVIYNGAYILKWKLCLSLQGRFRD